MSTMPALICACTMPFSPTISVSVDAISPRNLPFSMTVPLNVYLPSISEPSSMKAVRSLVLTPLLPFFFHSIGRPHVGLVHATGLRRLVLDEVDRTVLAHRVRVLRLDSVAVEEAALRDDEGVRPDVAAHAARGRDLDGRLLQRQRHQDEGRGH